MRDLKQHKDVGPSCMATARANVTTVAPNRPSQDFFGLIVGARGRLPQNEPNRKAEMS